jgi:hypothetical protein
VLEHPAARALADFRNDLPAPAPLHRKRQHWLDLATLERIADLCLTEGRAPVILKPEARNPGVSRTFRFQRGLMLKLLVRIPLRQRNVRELRMGENLYTDASGHVHLHFRGSELKVGDRNGQANKYHVDLTEYCPDFLAPLEEFLTTFRPRLPNALTSTSLFLTRHGTPFTQSGLRTELSAVVARHTGQRFYPHLIRTIWATQYLQDTGDFTTAATMLGDTLQITMRTYYDVVHNDQHAKARAFLGRTLPTG